MDAAVTEMAEAVVKAMGLAEEGSVTVVVRWAATEHSRECRSRRSQCRKHKQHTSCQRHRRHNIRQS